MTAGTIRSTRRFSAETWTRAKQLLDDGVPVASVASETGIAAMTLYSRFPRGKAIVSTSDAPPRNEYEGTVAASYGVEAESQVPPGVEARMVAGEIASESLRTRLLRAIVENGPFDTLDDLMKFIRRPGDNFGAHEAYHLLATSLASDGLVSYRMRGHGAGSAHSIKPTARAYSQLGYNVAHREAGRSKWLSGRLADSQSRGRDRTDYRTHRASAEGGPIEHRAVAPSPIDDDAEVVSIATPEIEQEPRASYPVLDALRERRDARRRAEASSSAYLAAAAALEGVDDDEHQRLLGLAERAEGEPFSLVEAEYLSFAEKEAKWASEK